MNFQYPINYMGQKLKYQKIEDLDFTFQLQSYGDKHYCQMEIF